MRRYNSKKLAILRAAFLFASYIVLLLMFLVHFDVLDFGENGLEFLVIAGAILFVFLALVSYLQEDLFYALWHIIWAALLLLLALASLFGGE